MPVPDPFLVFIGPINRASLRYAVTGSVAAIFYGEPRVTHDVDIIMFLNGTDIRRLSEIFPSDEFYVPPQESIVAEVARPSNGQFNIIHLASAFKADIYPTGRDELMTWAFRRKRPIEYKGETIVLAPPEYVILRKLEYFKEGKSDKHLRDIRGILAISREQIDTSALMQWIQKLELEAEWRSVSP